MELDRRACDRARRARDARFDGKFFIGAMGAGIYCRPICPAPSVLAPHVRYFPSAAAAEAAGLRPCLRCRPEASPGTPAWLGTSALVSRALRLIGDGALDDGTVEQLAERLGVTAGHARRLFLQHLGATPHQVAQTRRLHFAKKLIDETTLRFDHVAFAAGFQSVRRFNGLIRGTYERTPSELRRLTRQKDAVEPERYRLRLTYRPPYDWDGVLAFLRAHAVAGIEAVEAGHYRRTIALDGSTGAIDVSRAKGEHALALEVRFPEPRALLAVVERVKRIFDLGADPRIIELHLRADPTLRVLLERWPGVRVPGAWDPFELAVRTLLEQDLPLPEAQELVGRIAARYGTPVAGPWHLERAFPQPASLSQARLERIGVAGATARALRTLAHRWREATSLPAVQAEATPTVALLEAIAGVRASTAQYVAMRALGEPDAFPADDRALRRIAGGSRGIREVTRRSDGWRPWRAYALALLWRDASDEA